MNTPDPSQFPDPACFGTSDSSSLSFRSHKTLGTCKLSIKQRFCWRTRGVTSCDVYIYEFTPDAGWTVVRFFPNDTHLDSDPWYRAAAKNKSNFAPSDASVDKAIASIMGKEGR